MWSEIYQSPFFQIMHAYSGASHDKAAAGDAWDPSSMSSDEVKPSSVSMG